MRREGGRWPGTCSLCPGATGGWGFSCGTLPRVVRGRRLGEGKAELHPRLPLELGIPPGWGEVL